MITVPVRLRIPIASDWRFDHTIQVYTDQGTGVLDTDNPLLSQPLRSFGDVDEPLPWTENAWGSVPWGNHVPRLDNTGGWGEWPWGEEPNGWCLGGDFCEGTVYVDQGFGDYKFAAKAIDGAGNAQAGALVEFTERVSGEHPEPLSAFAFDSELGGGELQFSYSL